MKTKLILISVFFFLNLSSKIISQSLQWRNIPGIPGSSRYDDLFFTDPNTGWIIQYNFIHKTTNSGETWTIYDQPGSNRSIGFFDSETGIIGTLDSGRTLSRTTNGGINWSIVSGLPVPKPRGVCGISIVDDSCAYFVGAYSRDGRAYRTTDKGANWEIVFNDSSLARTLVDCYFWSRDSGLIAGGYNTDSFLNGNSVVLITTNGGINWQKVYKSSRTKEWCWKISFNKSFSESFGVISIERHPNYGLSYLIKTTNKGINWTEIPFMAYDQEGIGFLNENTGWIGGYGSSSATDSTYMTTNGGITWSKAGWGKSMNRIRFINDTLAFASGVTGYKYSRTMVGIPFVFTEIPDNFKLYQNYPNPFNPITLIKYDIPKNKNRITVKTSLIVYDALGKQIRELVNDNLQPGSHQAVFDAGYFPSGIYFYTLETSGVKLTKRMILLK